MSNSNSYKSKLKQRIQLAEAMGHTIEPSGSLWSVKGGPLNSFFLFRGPGYEVADLRIWNPFVKADHDYIVLEFIRKGLDGWHLDAFNELSQEDQCDYQIGNYARAALKELNNG